MCLNVFFETELFKTNQDFIDSFEYRKYKNSLGIKDEESEHLGFESVSAKTVVDENKIVWKKFIIAKCSFFSKNLTSSCYNKKILDKFSEHVDKPKIIEKQAIFCNVGKCRGVSAFLYSLSSKRTNMVCRFRERPNLYC